MRLHILIIALLSTLLTLASPNANNSKRQATMYVSLQFGTRIRQRQEQHNFVYLKIKTARFLKSHFAELNSRSQSAYDFRNLTFTTNKMAQRFQLRVRIFVGSISIDLALSPSQCPIRPRLRGQQRRRHHHWRHHSRRRFRTHRRLTPGLANGGTESIFCELGQFGERRECVAGLCERRKHQRGAEGCDKYWERWHSSGQYEFSAFSEWDVDFEHCSWK